MGSQQPWAFLFTVALHPLKNIDVFMVYSKTLFQVDNFGSILLNP